MKRKNHQLFLLLFVCGMLLASSHTAAAPFQCDGTELALNQTNTEHVSGYTRKDGTAVRDYERRSNHSPEEGRHTAGRDSYEYADGDSSSGAEASLIGSIAEAAGINPSVLHAAKIIYFVALAILVFDIIALSNLVIIGFFVALFYFVVNSAAESLQLRPNDSLSMLLGITVLFSCIVLAVYTIGKKNKFAEKHDSWFQFRKIIPDGLFYAALMVVILETCLGTAIFFTY